MPRQNIASLLPLLALLAAPPARAEAASSSPTDTSVFAALTLEQRTARFRAVVAEADRLAEVSALLAAGADPLDQLDEGHPPIIVAIRAGQPSYAEAMLASHPRLGEKFWPDPRTRVTVGMVALHEALTRAQHTLARRLLEHEKIKPTDWRPAYDERTLSVLGLAVKHWDAETVRLLVESGARFAPLPAGEGFFTLLEDYAIRRPTPRDLTRKRDADARKARQDANTLESLRQKVAEASTPEAKSRTEASLRRLEEIQRNALERDREWATRADPLQKIRLLSSFRSPGSPGTATGVNDERVDRSSPLSLAVARDWPEVVAVLVQNGADPRIGLVEHRPILEYAADKPSLLRALNGEAPADRPTSPSEPPSVDGPAFVAAIAKGDAAFLRDTPLTAELLAYRDPKRWTLLHHAINHGDDATALRLIASGSELEAATASGQTPLTFAGFKARPAVARALLAQNASPRPPESGLPPLAGACVGNDLEIVRLLLAAGADPRDTYDGGVPLILCAAQHSSPEIIGLLVGHGATLDATDRKGTGPLEVAFFQDNSAALAWMLDHGGRWRSAAHSEQTGPLLAAVRRRAWRCAHLLLERGEIDARALPLASDPQFKAALEDRLQAAGSNALDDEELWPAICADRENWKARVDAHLAKGGDVNYSGSDWTPLLKAFYAGNLDLVRHLLAHGADPKKHPREQMHADMITLAHLYQGTFGKPEHLNIPEFISYRAEVIRLLAPLEPSEEYEHFLVTAVRNKRWEEIEAYVSVGTPTDRARHIVTRMANLKDDERTRLDALLAPR